MVRKQRSQMRTLRYFRYKMFPRRFLLDPTEFRAQVE